MKHAHMRVAQELRRGAKAYSRTRAARTPALTALLYRNAHKAAARHSAAPRRGHSALALEAIRQKEERRKKRCARSKGQAAADRQRITSA